MHRFDKIGFSFCFPERNKKQYKEWIHSFCLGAYIAIYSKYLKLIVIQITFNFYALNEISFLLNIECKITAKMHHKLSKIVLNIYISIWMPFETASELNKL